MQRSIRPGADWAKGLLLFLILTVLPGLVDAGESSKGKDVIAEGQMGPRPYFLVEQMRDGALKTRLEKCASRHKSYKPHNFSIGHRGAPMQFPEHTRESYVAAAQMGAGILECDVTFTKDRELVCRHSQCDLHTTTNILVVPELAAKCSEPFTPAQIDPETGEVLQAASATCCTSDITIAEFKTLRGKMDAFDSSATTPEEYLGGTADWRTDLYSGPNSGELLTHAGSIELFKSLGVGMTPELKSPSVSMPYEGDYTQEDYAQQMIDEYKAAGVKARRVWAQSFNLADVLYWIENEPAFGKQAVYLDGRYGESSFDHTDPSTWKPSMQDLVEDGVRVLAPPTWMLVRADDKGDIAPSVYAEHANAVGLKLITWTLERSGILADGDGGWYYQTIQEVLDARRNEGVMMELLDVLARDVGVIGVFSDWPATTSFYANCELGKRGRKK